MFRSITQKKAKCDTGIRSESGLIISQSRRNFLSASLASGAFLSCPLTLAQSHTTIKPIRPSSSNAKPIDIQPIVNAALTAIKSAQLQPGRYTRYLGDQRKTRPKGSEENSYGCAAAACILYTVGHFPRSLKERKAFVKTMQANQAIDTGFFSEPNHGAYHSTAYISAALELFDSAPLHPLHNLKHLLAPNGIEQLLESLDWLQNPWESSHQGAGSFAALYLSGDASTEWQDRYFNWLWQNQDPLTGLWRKECQSPIGGEKSAPFFHHLASSFHYLFNHVAARRSIRYPEAMINSALRIRRENLHTLGQGPGFSELDWLYCLTRPARQSGYRMDEILTELKEFAQSYIRNLLNHIAIHPTPFQDLHTLNGTMSALAELQQALPGELRSERPLRLILDRRPFI